MTAAAPAPVPAFPEVPTSVVALSPAPAVDLAEAVARARLRYEALLALLGRVERRAAAARGRPATESRRRVAGLSEQVEDAHRHLVDLEERLERRPRPRPVWPAVPTVSPVVPSSVVPAVAASLAPPPAAPVRRRPAVVQPVLFDL
jgi:hypothetical protein